MPWAPDYISTRALADYLHTDDDVDQVEMASAIASASRAIDRAAYRQFGSVAPEPRIYSPLWSTKRGMWVIECDDFPSMTKIELDTAGDGTFATEVSMSSALFLPVNALAKGRPYERVALRNTTAPLSTLGPDSARLTAPWGWISATYPAGIVAATKLQASRVFNRRNSPYGIAGSPDQGSELRLLARLDPDVLVAIRPYRRDVWLS